MDRNLEVLLTGSDERTRGRVEATSDHARIVDKLLVREEALGLKESELNLKHTQYP